MTAITSSSAALAVAEYALIALFFLIDFLPTGLRILLRFGSPSPYEKILESQTQIILESARREAALRSLAAAHEIEEAVTLADAAAAQKRGPAKRWSGPPAPFRELSVPHVDGELRRLELGDDEFLLVDVIDDVPTLNWTASIGGREFALLISEHLEQADDARESSGEIMISMAGISELRYEVKVSAESLSPHLHYASGDRTWTEELEVSGRRDRILHGELRCADALVDQAIKMTVSYTVIGCKGTGAATMQLLLDSAS